MRAQTRRIDDIKALTKDAGAALEKGDYAMALRLMRPLAQQGDYFA